MTGTTSRSYKMSATQSPDRRRLGGSCSRSSNHTVPITAVFPNKHRVRTTRNAVPKIRGKDGSGGAVVTFQAVQLTEVRFSTVQFRPGSISPVPWNPPARY
ncbi:uncharacterized protein LOC118428784 [Branchiostoma floridae]|uniref:Uncharacterized protein LOC118428784 n=1 Tax=Branchiostoma floridae TaxID=7739 RepID=A0A9J7NA33_BRAFL|nr:uncharacterized protein LOC118428784 [Branchiostoma floridae]